MTADRLVFLPAAVYWLLVVCWTTILVFYWREYRRLRALSPLVATMVALIFVDGARTLLESVYFGTWYTARTGLFPRYLWDVLAQPHYIIVPKLVNLAAALAIIFFLARRWFRDMAAEVERHRRTERLYAELAEAHEKLKRAQEARDALTHFLVHDMRIPLTSVITGLRTAQQWETQDGLTAEMIRAALSGSERVLGMVNNILDISRIEAGEMPVERAVLDVVHSVEEVLGQMDLLVREKGILLTRSWSADKPPRVLAVADGEKFRRVLMNLLANAIRFTPGGGTIAVSVEQQDGSVRVTVTDNGPGIPPEDQERIFSKFAQAQTNNGRAGGGSGLGLAFSRLAVELMGGKIGVESAPGKGSCFWFTLPAVPSGGDGAANRTDVSPGAGEATQTEEGAAR
ncbi:MAG: HAMP domain-containing sensor histidine kinase [Armatimonadota bacterium]|nr:HAMP domain-containing sensor histidine kinase [Armatimonadota bacterium]